MPQSEARPSRARGRPARYSEAPKVPSTPPAPTSEAKFRGAIAMLTQLMAARSGNQSSPTLSSSSQEPSAATRIRDFLRMNPPTFTGSKVDEDPQNFIDEMWKILKAMHATEIEGVELVSYQLKDVANIWYNQWEQGRGEDVEPVRWDEFEGAFLDHFFPRELREAKVEEFVNLKQEGMTVKA
ncbi:uncharacterized protein LOC129887498 [Solanum dulcamara]|uniref:uncharacterized protein LOC129887498 n=1 Tax=Solanum dulcamara TaxID=45834 RepID=UPI002485B3D3|nr:uncharacterized protein LOC129887498 [Solanum dulcamara]